MSKNKLADYGSVPAEDIFDAVAYYQSMPKSIVPIKDKGWMSYSVEVRMKASEVIAQEQL